MLNTKIIKLFLVITGSVQASFGLFAKEEKPFFPICTSCCSTINATDIIETYFANFEILAKSEKWKEIISQGIIALEAAKNANRPYDEAKICAQLTSTAFYLGDYTQSLIYASWCHELSEEFTDQSLFIRALYLESAIYRALATKTDGKQAQQASYLRAVEIAEEAFLIYSRSGIKDINLKGKIYFNLGAAHADNPQGDLEKAENCYFIALECFNSVKANEDVIRTSIRLGKVYLLQKNYSLSQKIIDEVRIQIACERLEMHVDYLEAQLKLALNDIENASRVAKNGLARAKNLEAKEDELRLTALLHIIENLSENH